METTRFDKITRKLAETSSRRQAVAALLAAVVGTAAVSTDDASARRRRRRRRPTCTATNGACTASTECCGWEDYLIVCGYASNGQTTECCRNPGAECRSDHQCCGFYGGTAHCTNHVCGA